jgi:hypothetical protein
MAYDGTTGSRLSRKTVWNRSSGIIAQSQPTCGRRGSVTGTVVDHLDSPSCFGLYFSIHSCSLKTLGTSM